MWYLYYQKIADIWSINVSLVSGGFETLSTTGLAGLGYLASPKGQEIQEKAYSAIMATYSTAEEAWQKCLTEESVPYIVAVTAPRFNFYLRAKPSRSLYTRES